MFLVYFFKCLLIYISRKWMVQKINKNMKYVVASIVDFVIVKLKRVSSKFFCRKLLKRRQDLHDIFVLWSLVFITFTCFFLMLSPLVAVTKIDLKKFFRVTYLRKAFKVYLIVTYLEKKKFKTIVYSKYDLIVLISSVKSEQGNKDKLIYKCYQVISCKSLLPLTLLTYQLMIVQCR